jgi:hypothetical protein
MVTIHARSRMASTHQPSVRGWWIVDGRSFDSRSANADRGLTDSMFDVERWALNVLAVGRNALPRFRRLPWFRVASDSLGAPPWGAGVTPERDRPPTVDAQLISTVLAEKTLGVRPPLNRGPSFRHHARSPTPPPPGPPEASPSIR